MSWVRLVVGACVVGVSAVFAALHLGRLEVRQLTHQVEQLQLEREKLIDYAEKLSSSRRVGQLDVVKQLADDQGRVVNTLLWQEIGDDGMRGRPVAIETIGELVYVEALVIKFEPQHIAEDDEARGASLALFRRVFGDDQAPSGATELDRFARPPLAGDDPRRADELHDRLWEAFWSMIDDPQIARNYGVRIAQIEAPAVPIKDGDVLEVRLDTAGGLNLRKMPTN